MPEAVASFGAAVDRDWLYVFGGHIGRAHVHSVSNLAKGLRRLNLVDGQTWEDLTDGPLLQAAPLLTYKGNVYRVGGLSARNQRGEDEDLHSVADLAKYDFHSKQWVALTPMPKGRSSHDAVVYEGKLYVVGGWTLKGAGNKGQWLRQPYYADLEAETIEWKELPAQPFARRALAVAAAGGKIYAMGGIQAEGGTSDQVDILDLHSGTWSKGPAILLKSGLKGFGSSAFAVGGRVYLSASDGRLSRLSQDGKSWEDQGVQLKKPRFFHRMVPYGDERLLFIGGASREGHLSDVEVVQLGDPAKLLEVETASANVDVSYGPPSSGSPSSRWAGFRGDGSGRSEADQLPLKWAEDAGIAWTARLPGYGQSSPIVWNDRVFVTSSQGRYKDTLIISALDLETGGVIWRRRLGGSQKTESSEMVSRSAPTPAVDAQRLYVFFESGDLFAFDHEGNDLWQRSLTREYGLFQGNHGIGSSLAQNDESLFLLIDHGGPSYLMSVDKATGRNNWKLERPKRVSWTSPLVSRYQDREELILSSNGIVEAYDAVTSRRLWFVEGVQKNTVASPSVSGDLVVIGSSEKSHNLAIKRGGKGDVSKSHVLWKAEASSSFGSPLIYGDCVYYVNRAGVATCADIRTGKAKWTHRLGEACWASPIAADGRIYFFSKNGVTTVMSSSSEKAEILSQNKIESKGTVYGVGAIEGSFIIRTGSKVIRVGKSS